MADTVVTLVLNKLADAVVKEALFMYGVSDRIGWVQRELTWIESFLKDANARHHQDERVKCWVNEVKELGYLIEDTLDMFLIEVGEDVGTLKNIGKLPMKLIAKHKLGTAIEKIQQRINEISANTTKYGIEGLKDSTMVSSSKLPVTVTPIVIPDLDKTEVVGFEVNTRTVVDRLVDTNVTRRSVVSIVGAGGSGKTTLAKEVYKRTEVKSHFDIRLWVTVSEEYKLKDILIKMLEGMNKQVDSEMRQKGEEHLIIGLHNAMKERKYLVVLDDVWSNNLWSQLHVALPEINNGSRVLITTRFIMIAKEVDAISEPYKIKALNEEESQRLLLKKTFPNQYAHECPEDLRPLARQFAEKCGGWPLALVVLGGILSKRIPNYIAWDELMRNIDWHTEGSGCMSVISTSYEVLPFHLKPCFMYFAVFPEDYRIKATTLIQLWVAEGFISHDASRTMEDVAESYLEELVQRCMVQVSSRSVIGKIKYCQIHDLLREVAIQKAKEDNFLKLLSKDDATLSVGSSARRVALHNFGNMPLKHACKNLRSLSYFGDFMPNCKRFGMLRVLNVDRKVDLSNKERWLKCLTDLRYFRFPRDIHDTCPQHFSVFARGAEPVPYYAPLNPSHLARMKNLQTVDMRAYPCHDNGKLYPSFWDKKQLRHAILSRCFYCRSDAPDGPPSAADLRNLLTLKGVKAQQEWCAKLPHFPHLRKLGLILPSNVDHEAIVNSLSNLPNLGSLSLETTGGNNQLEFPCGGAMDFGSHQHLHSLRLKWGKWLLKQKAVDCGTILPSHLMKLTLHGFSFEEDPMPQLEKLPNLTVLKLDGALTSADKKRSMICCRGGFSRLQKLVLCIECFGKFGTEWTIEAGAMPLLNQLVLVHAGSLNKVPDLQYLTDLRELEVGRYGDGLKRRLQGDDQWRISHVSSVTYSSWCLSEL